MTLTEHYVALSADQKRAPLVKPVVNALTEVLARLLLIRNAYMAFNKGKSPMIRFPYSEVQTTVDQIDSLIELATANLDVPWDLNVALRDELRALRRLRLIKDLFTSFEKSSEAVNNVFLVQSRSRKGYMVQWGDTLRGVAQRFLNDGDRWLEIATLNSLDYPYVAKREADISAGKAVAIPGDLITLPLDAQDPHNQVVGSAPTDYGTLLGQDIALTQDGYLEFDAQGDLRVVSGGENLAQAVRHRLIVPKGQLPLHADYGCELELYIGIAGTPAAVQQAAMEVRRTVRQDPRITRVENAVTIFQASALTATLTARVIGQESPAELNLVIPR